MQKLSSSIVLFFPLLFVACGDYLDFGEEEELVQQTMTISSHELTLMVGDSCKLSASFSPDDGKEHSVFWASDSTERAVFVADTVVGVSAGKLKVRCTSVNGGQKDSCTVTVIPNWTKTLDIYAHQYDMVVYASVQVGNATNSDKFVIGAFIDDELCGTGRLLRTGNTTYWAIRIYSDEESDEDNPVNVTFRCYERGKGVVTTFDKTIEFDGMTHGTLSNLIELKK